MADQQFSDETKKQMRDTVLRWIGDAEKPAEPMSIKAEEPVPAPEVKAAPMAPVNTEQKMSAEKKAATVTEQSASLGTRENINATEEVPVVAEKIADFVATKETVRQSVAPSLNKVAKNKNSTTFFSNWFKSFKESHKTAVDDRGGLKYFLIAGLAIVVVWAATFFVIRQGYLNPTARQFMAENIPIPYARLGSHFLWLPTWYDERAAIDHYYQQNQTANVDLADTRDIASTAMVRRAMLEELASQYKLRVSDAEINAEVTRLQSNVGNSDSLNRLVQTIWGWSLADFKGKLIRPYLLKQKLIVKLKEDPVLGRDFGQSSDQQILDQYLDKLAKSQLSQWIDLKNLP
jgi:hypothetical protein